ncbi:MAG: hypothetical protein R3300_01365, partial [Candidatus Promineifilaceae bacterium]|nr:hypothetical protein [Candidatus Promineifilaceae bacterium]
MINSKLAERQVRQALRPGLFLKLMGAFLLVLIIMATLVTWQARQATRNEFSTYTTLADQRQAQTLAPLLADYYQRNGSWDGVETALEPSESAMPMMGQGMGRGRGAGAGAGVGQMMRGTDFWEMSGVRALVADAAGQVLAD